MYELLELTVYLLKDICRMSSVVTFKPKYLTQPSGLARTEEATTEPDTGSYYVQSASSLESLIDDPATILTQVRVLGKNSRPSPSPLRDRVRGDTPSPPMATNTSESGN